MDNIWFDLCVGNVEVDAEGIHAFTPKHTRLSQLTTTADITSVSKYRLHLHKLLDKAIDHIEANLQNDNPPSPLL